MNSTKSDGGSDFLVAGSIAVSLVDASPAEVRAVSAQLGLEPSILEVEPDVVVHYRDRLEPTGPLRQAGLGQFGWADDRFWMLRGVGNRRVRLTIDPHELALPLRLTCERRGVGIPLLTQMLSTVVAARGGVAVHAAAFRLHGQNVLVAGWSDGGKSEALLAAVLRGAVPIGDDTVYLDAATGRLRGLPVPMRLKAWYLGDVPEIRRNLGWRDRLRTLPSGTSAAIARRSTLDPGTSTTARVLRKSLQLVDRAMTVSTPLTDVAGTPVESGDTVVDHVVLVVNADIDSIRVHPADPAEVALRVQASLQDERANLADAYRQLRFSCPGVSWPLMDQVDDAETRSLTAAFARAEVWQLDHPHPVGITELADSIEAIVSSSP